MTREPFTRRATLMVGTLGATSLLAALGVGLAGGAAAPTSSAADSYSRSALGHHAFVALLRELGVQVLVSRWRSGERAAGGLLVVAEPRLEGSGPSFETLLAPARSVLLVLPKRSGAAGWGRAGWLGGATLVSERAAAAPLRALGVEAEVWRGGAGEERPLALDLNPLAHAPTLASPQLVRSAQIEPVIASGEGILLGRFGGGTARGTRYVLSDPDLLATHALGDGDNAALAVAVVELLLPAGGAVVVDEALHGHAQPPSLAMALTRTPLAWIAVQLALLTIGAVWAGLGRFGAPLAEPAALGHGKQGLIDSTAELLRFGGHWRLTLHRYAMLLIGDVARRMHAPAGLEGGAVVPWLRRMSGVRGASSDPTAAIAAVERAASPEEALRIAGSLASWRKEILHGFEGGRRPR